MWNNAQVGTIRHATWRENGETDFARMDGVFKDHGTDEDWMYAVGFHLKG